MCSKFKLFKDSLFYHRSRSLERSCSSFTLAVHRGGKHGNYRLYSLPGQICIYKKYCPSSSIPATYLCNWFQIGPKIWPSIDIKHNFRCTWSLTTKHQLSKFPCIRHFSRLSIHFEWLIVIYGKTEEMNLNKTFLTQPFNSLEAWKIEKWHSASKSISRTWPHM